MFSTQLSFHLLSCVYMEKKMSTHFLFLYVLAYNIFSKNLVFTTQETNFFVLLSFFELSESVINKIQYRSIKLKKKKTQQYFRDFKHRGGKVSGEKT